jgi:hypothetical protein
MLIFCITILVHLKNLILFTKAIGKQLPEIQNSLKQLLVFLHFYAHFFGGGGEGDVLWSD